MHRDKIFQLYIQHFSGHNSQEEETLIREKLRDDADFAAVWKELEEESNSLNAEDFLQRMDTQAALEAHHRRRRRIVNMQRFRMATAASILLLMALGGAWYLHTKNNTVHGSLATLVTATKPQIQLSTNNGASVTLDPIDSSRTIRIGNAVITSSGGGMEYTSVDTTQNTLTVPAGQHYRIILSDGSEVWLNAATTLRFPFHFPGNKREVYVNGEAYFKIKEDPQRPFLVRTDLNDVQVLGTSFNINTYTTGSVQTSLTSGQVMVRNSSGTAQLLKPGNQAVYTENSFHTRHFDAADVLAWMDGTCYYHGMALKDLAGAASRFYGLHFTIGNEQIQQRTFTGLMERSKLEDFLSDLKITGNITYAVNGNDIVLK